MAYVETPRTDAGNATYMSNAHNLEGFSVENSFLSPSKTQDDLVSQLRNGRGLSLKTPRSRVPFTDRQNLLKPSSRGEFTPLLKSAARNSMLQNGKFSGAPKTPAFLKAGYEETNSPGLPAAEVSGLYGDDTRSSVGVDGDDTPVPQIASSSGQSTPLAVLPRRDAGGVLADQGNVMTLREQENVINRIEKENFGLKLKIHFLEEALRKAGPGFHEAALKENTDLKVDRVTMQKELSRAKKTLSQAEREVETYRRHLQDVQEDTKRKHIDEGLQIELETLRGDVAAKDSELKDLKERLKSVEGNEEELEKAKDDAEDLEAEIRERDRLIEERDGEIERLQAREKNDSEEMAELREELQKVEGTLSGRETKLKEALESEKQRFQSEEDVLGRQIQDLCTDVDNKRHMLDDLRAELSDAKEELEKAKDDAEDLEAEIRERDRLIEERDGEIERLQAREKNDSEEMAELRDELQKVEGTLSGRETKLKEALESEKQRFQSEEDVLGRQIQDLCIDVDKKRHMLDDLRAELSDAKEELRTCLRDQSIWGEKVQELEDELEVLQAERDDEAERATEAINVATLLQEQLDIATEELGRGKTLHSYAQVQDSSNKQLTTEHELEDEIKRASAEEARLNNEIDDLRHKVTTASEGRDQELLAARQKAQRLESQISALQSRLAQVEQGDDATAEPSFFQEDLTAARAKETEFLQREATHKDSIRDLKRNVARLERQLHEVEIARLAVDSPQPSVIGSGRKEEIAELRRQLADAHHQIKDSRTKSRECERELQRKLAELNQHAQSDQDARERERDHWELEISSCRVQHDQQLAKAAAAENNLARLRLRVQNLEKDLQVHRQTAAGDLTMADERKDLHEMLKDAKLTAESLQVEISSRETLLAASSSREKELRAHIRRIREERNVQLEKSTALSSELEHLQGRYERAVDNFTRQQKTWEEERKKLTSGVRFVNTSLSSVHDGDATAELKEMDRVIWEKEKRHESELLGLANQIHWLKAMGRREERFRHSLVHGKQYLLEEIEIRNRYTKASLTLLAKMGIASPYPPPPLQPGATELERSKHVLDSMKNPASKRPGLRAVGLMLMAGAEMKRLAGKWAAVKRSNVEAGRSHIAEKTRNLSDNGKGTPDKGRSIVDSKGKKKES